jgi:hypothetical protein
LSEAFNYFRDGVSIFEKVYDIEDGKIIIKKLGVRLPRTVLKRQTRD